MEISIYYKKEFKIRIIIYISVYFFYSACQIIMQKDCIIVNLVSWTMEKNK